jgi:hypothetical protein
VLLPGPKKGLEPGTNPQMARTNADVMKRVRQSPPPKGKLATVSSTPTKPSGTPPGSKTMNPSPSTRNSAAGSISFQPSDHVVMLTERTAVQAPTCTVYDSPAHLVPFVMPKQPTSTRAVRVRSRVPGRARQARRLPLTRPQANLRRAAAGNTGWMVLALIAVVLAGAGCSSSVHPRQADRHSDAAVPVLSPPGDIFVVAEGNVIEEFQINGIIEPANRTEVVPPLDGWLTASPPYRGTEVEAGDVLFEIEPTTEVRAAATELEAARLALLLASPSEYEQAQTRVDQATQQAAAFGVPIDDPNALPLPATIAVTSPITATVIETYPPDTGPAFRGTTIVELGDPESPTVRANLTTTVTQQLGLSTEITLAEDGNEEAIPATVSSIDLSEEGTALVSLVTAPGALTSDEDTSSNDTSDDNTSSDETQERFAPESEVTIEWVNGTEASGVVGTSELTQPGSLALQITVAADTFVFGTETTVRRRDGQEPVAQGTLVTIEFSEDDTPVITVLTEEGAFDFGTPVWINLTGITRSNVLWLPPEAIRTFRGESYVIVIDEQGQHRVEVELGLSTTSRVEITGDLLAGETVIGP